jgi:hypothetical protein
LACGLLDGKFDNFPLTTPLRYITCSTALCVPPVSSSLYSMIWQNEKLTHHIFYPPSFFSSFFFSSITSQTPKHSEHKDDKLS